jgi:sugar/nucleoside kinase (ribokinase family)
MPYERNSSMLKEEIFQSANLCVVGNINRDIRLAPIEEGEYLFHDGETSVPWTAETVGGGGANSACAAAALGARVGLIAKTGADSLGKRLEETLTRHGVSAHLAKSATCATGTSVNVSFTTGHRHFVSSLPNNESLAFEDLPLAALEGYTHLFRADVWFSKHMLGGGNERLFQQARSLGMRVSLDLNWDPHWGVASAEVVRERKLAVRKVLPLVNLAHGNVRELGEFTDAPDLATSLARLEAWGVESVVVHLGSRGSALYRHGTMVEVAPVPAARQVNTTGTGDVLSVCMMLLDRRQDIPAADKLHFANRIVSEFIEGRRKLIPTL